MFTLSLIMISFPNNTLQVNNLSNEEVNPKLNIKIQFDKVNSAEPIDFLNENPINDEDFPQETIGEVNKKISDKTEKFLKEEDLSFNRRGGNEETQATTTTEFIRACAAEQDNVMIVKQESKVMTAALVVKLPSTDLKIETATHSTNQKNSQPQSVPLTVATTTAVATACRDLTTSIWIRNVSFKHIFIFLQFLI